MAASSPAAALAQALLTIGALWAGGELWRRGARGNADDGVLLDPHLVQPRLIDRLGWRRGW